MGQLTEFLDNIQALYEQAESAIFGDENTSATHNGQTRDSLAKAIKGKFDALQAMVQGRLTYETKAAMDAAGAPPAGELAEVWNDPTLENNGLYGWSGAAWSLSSYDPSLVLSNEIDNNTKKQIDKDDSIAISATQKNVPLNNDGLDFIWAVKAKKKVLGYFDGSGKWHSDHDHEGLPGKTVLTEAVDIIWGVKAGNTVLGYFDGSGKWHSDHDHPEFQSLQDQITAQQSEIDLLEITGASAIDLLVRVDSTGVYDQLIAYDGLEQKTISKTDSNWIDPVVHHTDVVRCFSDYTTGDLQPHTILKTGEIIPERNVLLQQMVTGQSLSLGSRGYILNPDGEYIFDSPNGVGDLFTTECPSDLLDSCLTLENGARNTGTTLIPTVELASGVLGETICSSYMIKLARIIEEKSYGTIPRLASAISGQGGVPYDSLKKGTSVYSGALSRTSSIAAAAASNGWGHVVTSIRIVHGEGQAAAADPYDVTEDGYAAVIREWVSDYQLDLVSITGQNQPPVGILCQVNTQGVANFDVPLAQLKAHIDNDDIILISPKYQYPYYDSAHMLAEGYVKTGEIESHAMFHWFSGRKWEPLRPESVVLSGTTITVNLNSSNISDSIAGPVGDVVIDTETISDPGDFGFTLSDEAISINSVSIGPDKNSVIIELSDIPETGTKLFYAMQVGNFQPNNGCRGNIRDSDNRLISRFDGLPIRNWLVAFQSQIN